MEHWRAALLPSAHRVQILVTDPLNNETLKAELPAAPAHPRALMTLLEGVALWAGAPLTVVTSAERPLRQRFGEALFVDLVRPVDGPLVRFEFVDRPARRRTLAGIGDFSALRVSQRRAR